MALSHVGAASSSFPEEPPLYPPLQNPAHKPKTAAEQMLWICCGSCFWGCCERAPQMSRGFEDELLITCVLSIQSKNIPKRKPLDVGSGETGNAVAGQ